MGDMGAGGELGDGRFMLYVTYNMHTDNMIAFFFSPSCVWNKTLPKPAYPMPSPLCQRYGKKWIIA